jgi:hypothetical protein
LFISFSLPYISPFGPLVYLFLQEQASSDISAAFVHFSHHCHYHDHANHVQNGGHCQPLVYGAAPAVAAFELEVFDFLQKLVKDENIDCDWSVFSLLPPTTFATH